MSGDHPAARQFDRFRHVKRPSEALTLVSGRSLPKGFVPEEWKKHQTVDETDLSTFELIEITAHGYAYKRGARVSVAERGRPLPASKR
jgi:hypothetical protein